MGLVSSSLPVCARRCDVAMPPDMHQVLPRENATKTNVAKEVDVEKQCKGLVIGDVPAIFVESTESTESTGGRRNESFPCLFIWHFRILWPRIFILIVTHTDSFIVSHCLIGCINSFFRLILCTMGCFRGWGTCSVM